MATSETPLGHCGRVTDETNELLCGNIAVAEVLVRTKFGLMTALLCAPCLAEHKKFYSQLRRSGKRSGRRRHHHNSMPTPAADESPPCSTPGSNRAEQQHASAEICDPRFGSGAGLAELHRLPGVHERSDAA